MCQGPATLNPAAVSRRIALSALTASLLAGLGACSDGTSDPGPAGTTPDPAATDSTPAALADAGAPTTPPAPAATKRIRKSFIPDVGLPPVVNGLAPVVTRILTKHPVVFLTIDDGDTKNPEMAALMSQYDYPVTIFLAQTFVKDNPAFFKQFQAQGSLIENHTISHNINMVQKLGYAQQLAEINGMQDFARDHYGRLPALFRPPGGAYSNVMRKAVADAGLKAIITWEAKANAGKMDYQYGNALRPGDIVLMHFRPEFAADLAAFRQAQLAAGLEVVLLEDFLGVR
ncbi:polysaccharide deacetylase family protein [Arthrobacter sp. ISL-48]|uniref:polysaccharide deacetylase family protein n=1 Tax=Arthrobacter sp. ISL-48 TaxID=2819110 RepID=UPI001BECFB2C|nr:polysaccharide deacetylase family protein [Arthrobacter sp. ISL-48]MBT2534091.1 polysaccharide deacetylase family protein [Arthrobacter sp. ISL-48]